MASIVISEERGVRYLHLGSPEVQGAMRLARPWSLEIEYTRFMMMPLLFRAAPAWPRHVLQVGLGAGSITRFLYRHRPEAALSAVELHAEVVEAARRHFRLPDDPARLRIHVAEGGEFLARSRERFDLVLVDAFDGAGRAGSLDTPAAYLACRRRLSRGGMAAFNLLSGRGLKARLARLREAFGESVIVLPRCEAGNTVVLAGAGARLRLDTALLRGAARTLRRESGLDLVPVVDALTTAG